MSETDAPSLALAHLPSESDLSFIPLLTIRTWLRLPASRPFSSLQSTHYNALFALFVPRFSLILWPLCTLPWSLATPFCLLACSGHGLPEFYSIYLVVWLSFVNMVLFPTRLISQKVGALFYRSQNSQCLAHCRHTTIAC